MWSSELQQTIIQRCKAVQYRLQEPLSRHTSFRIGGPAAVMAFPKTTEELKQLLQGAAAAGAQPYILGAGTNILAPDEGLDALVICLKVRCAASASWMRRGSRLMRVKAWRKRQFSQKITR